MISAAAAPWDGYLALIKANPCLCANGSDALGLPFAMSLFKASSGY